MASRARRYHLHPFFLQVFPVAVSWRAFRVSALWCWHQLLTLGLFVLVVVAVVVGVGRQLLPAVGSYRGDIEASLSRQAGMPVHLDAVQGEWEGLGPHFHLKGLELRDPVRPDTALLRIPEIELRPSLWGSLRHLEPRVDVRLRGLDIHIDQQPDGRLQLRELAGLASRDPQAAEKALRFALRQPLLAVSESRVGLNLQNLPALALEGVELVNDNDGDMHRVAGTLRLRGQRHLLGAHLDLRGDPLDWQQGELNAWLQLPQLPLHAWLPKLDAGGLSFPAITGGGEYWLHFRRGALQSLEARVVWRDVVVEGARGRHHLQAVTGNLAWVRAQDGWHLAGDALHGRMDDTAWPVRSFALRSTEGALVLAAAGVDIARSFRLLAGLPLEGRLNTWLHEAAPAGVLDSLRIDLAQDQGRWRPRRIDVVGHDIAMHAASGIPGVRGLAAWVSWTPALSLAGIDSRDAELDLPEYFRDPLVVHRLQSGLRLRVTDTGWLLESDRVQAANDDAQGSAVFRLDVPRSAPAAARLSLLAGFGGGRAASAWRYVPWPAAGDDTLAWLRRSVIDGTVARGDLLYEGPVSGPPQAHRLLMHFALSGGRLDYARGWPELKDLAADITLDGNRMEVEGRTVRLLDGSSAHDVHALIPDLGHPVLSVAGAVEATGADLMRLFRESPLKEHTASIPEKLDLDGAVPGRMQLVIPLQGGPVGIDVAARLAGNRLLLKQPGLVAGNVVGDIGYSSARGVTASGLTASLLEAPVVAAIQSTLRNGALDEVQVSLRGQVGIPALRRWMGSDLLGVASGGSSYQAQVRIPVDGPVRLLVVSPLSGVAVALPAPFGKDGSDTIPLRYQATLQGDEQIARLQYGRRLVAGLNWAGSRLERGLIRLDSAEVGWLPTPGLEVEGRMPRLDLQEWMPLLDRFAGKPAVKGASAGPALTRVELDVRELAGGGVHLQNAHFALNRLPASWGLAVASDELAGDAQLPDAPGSEVRLHFQRLQWPLPLVPEESPAAGVPMLGTRPLLLSADSVHLSAWPGFGALALKARLLPSPYGLRVEDIVVDNPALGFDGRLDWQWRGGVSTRLRGHARSENVAGLLSALGYAPSLISPRAAADIDLTWPAAPGEMQADSLEGRMDVVVEQGRLLSVSAGTSASRVFGWFDIDNIRRRFKGDFSDVLRRGLSFDKASLSGPVQGGVMAPATFLVDGPSLKAEGKGSLDLGHRQMDQEFVVTVPVTSAVPLAAVALGGPLIGGAVAAAEVALQKQIDKVTQLRYRVSGAWADPKVERLSAKTAPKKTQPGAGVTP